MKDLAIQQPENVLIGERLQTLGVALLSEWDALAFLYRHSASLLTAAQIARLIGCDKAEIGDALHRLETLGLIQRSRDSKGIRLYRFAAPSKDGRHQCLLELMRLAQNRKGRLLLIKHLKSPLREPRRNRQSGLRIA